LSEMERLLEELKAEVKKSNLSSEAKNLLLKIVEDWHRNFTERKRSEKRKYWSFDTEWGRVRAWFKEPVSKEESIRLVFGKRIVKLEEEGF